jgi:hypothetical protein
MAKRKSDLVRDKLAESRRLRKEMSEAGDEFVSSLRRIANRDGGWTVRSTQPHRARSANGQYVTPNTSGDISSKPASRVQAP